MSEDKDVRALRKTVEWIEKSSSERMKKATAEYIYDRYVRNPRRSPDTSNRERTP